MAGVLQDFNRMSTGKKVAIFVGVGIFAVLIYVRFVLNPLNEDVDAAKSAAAGAVAKAKSVESSVPKYKDLKVAIDKERPEIERNKKMLPSEAESFFETVETKAKASGVAIRKWTRKPEEQVDNFMRVPLDVELAGSFMQLKRFFASLVQEPETNSGDGATPKSDTAERIVSIENLVITQPPAVNKNLPLPPLTAKFVAITYRQDDRAMGAGSGSGSSATPIRPAGVAPMPTQGSAGAAAPLPSPASAKSKVEDAMKKSEERAGESANKDLLKKGN